MNFLSKLESGCLSTSLGLNSLCIAWTIMENLFYVKYKYICIYILRSTLFICSTILLLMYFLKICFAFRKFHEDLISFPSTISTGCMAIFSLLGIISTENISGMKYIVNFWYVDLILYICVMCFFLSKINKINKFLFVPNTIPSFVGIAAAVVNSDNLDISRTLITVLWYYAFIANCFLLPKILSVIYMKKLPDIYRPSMILVSAPLCLLFMSRTVVDNDRLTIFSNIIYGSSIPLSLYGFYNLKTILSRKPFTPFMGVVTFPINISVIATLKYISLIKQDIEQLEIINVLCVVYILLATSINVFVFIKSIDMWFDRLFNILQVEPDSESDLTLDIGTEISETSE